MKNCAVTIVGHVDHGKTSLVRALTGHETDRLAEEKARGLSITLGFAFRHYRAGVVDFIDSPGHEDFIRAMVCGATGAQAALIAISAVDGVERQTREHLDILQHLGVTTGIVALTKCDLVPADARDERRDEIADALSASSFADQPFVFCSASTGEGIERLHTELEKLIDRAPPTVALSGPALPVDRVFTMKGVGTVATGTLLGAPLSAGSDAVLLPDATPVSVRRLQSHGEDVAEARPGMRAAINLRGVPVERIRRGDVICHHDAVSSGNEIDVHIALEPGCGDLRHGDEVRLLIGTAAQVASVFVWGDRRSISETGGYARLRFPDPVATHTQQRGILRRLSPVETLGGITVLDPSPAPRRRKDPSPVPLFDAVRVGKTADIANQLARSNKGLVPVASLHRLTNTTRDQTDDYLGKGFLTLNDDYLAPSEWIDTTRDRLLSLLQSDQSVDAPRRPRTVAELQKALAGDVAEPLVVHVIDALLEGGELAGDRNGITLPNQDPFSGLSEDRRRRCDELEMALRDGGASPPSLSELGAEAGPNFELVELMAKTGRIVFLRNVGLKQTLVFHTDAIDRAYDALCEAFPSPTDFTMADARIALETSRKFAIPILEHFDKVGRTRRVGDLRSIIQQSH